MSTDTGSPMFGDMCEWITQAQSDASVAYDLSPQLTNRIERDVLAMRTRQAARYLTALADRLELFDA